MHLSKNKPKEIMNNILLPYHHIITVSPNNHWIPHLLINKSISINLIIKIENKMIYSLLSSTHPPPKYIKKIHQNIARITLSGAIEPNIKEHSDGNKPSKGKWSTRITIRVISKEILRDCSIWIKELVS